MKIILKTAVSNRNIKKICRQLFATFFAIRINCLRQHETVRVSYAVQSGLIV